MPIKNILKKMKDQHEEQLHKEAPPAHAEGGHDEGNWLISYADMMTLLCGFFIMLFALSNIQPEKYNKVAEEVSKHFGGNFENPNESQVQYFTQVIQEAGLQKLATVKAEGNGVSIVFESTVFFDTLSALVKDTGKEVMDKLIGAVGKRQIAEKKEYKIVVEGHTDGRPILSGNYPSNWELSGARATRVLRMFVEKGFSPQHLMAIGYADTRPKLPNRTPSGSWDEDALQKNRRVIIRILEPSVDSIPIHPPMIEAQAPMDPSAAPANTSH